MKLYHLDWTRSVARSEDDHFKLVSPFGLEKGALARRLFESDGLYELVATSIDDDVEEMYRLTQNGVESENWSLNPSDKLSPTEPNFHESINGNKLGRRSTSIGDIIEKDGRLLLCNTVGFDEI